MTYQDEEWLNFLDEMKSITNTEERKERFIRYLSSHNQVGCSHKSIRERQNGEHLTTTLTATA